MKTLTMRGASQIFGFALKTPSDSKGMKMSKMNDGHLIFKTVIDQHDQHESGFYC